MPDIGKLIDVFKDARELLDRPDNDFTWSSWDDREDALTEIDSILSRLQSDPPSESPIPSVLFAPTGPMQEVSLSSGWGDDFIALATRFDQAMAGNTPHEADFQRTASDCPCMCSNTPPDHLTSIENRGLDTRLAEISILACSRCGQHWLRYFHEVESVTASGRWYLGAITPEHLSTLALENAKDILEGLDWYYYGGSYYEGHSGRASGNIFPAP